VECFRSSGAPGRARVAAWNELFSSQLDRVDLIPASMEDFRAELRVGMLGPLRFARVICGSIAIERTPTHIAQAQRQQRNIFTFILQARGTATFSHYGHETRLAEGDCTLCHSAAPYSYRIESPSEIVMVRVPGPLLKEHLPSPEYFCGRHLAAGSGLTCTLAAVTRSICTQLEFGPRFDFQNRVARHLLEIIATAYAIAFDSLPTQVSSVVSGRHAKVKLYIEQHLRDPDLTPSLIAQRLNLSPRYLRMIFATSHETVTAYILRRRLEECARQMADPRWRGHSIAEIAFAWGFNSAPHFTRSFRDRYGVSPREYRRAHGGTEISGARERRAPAVQAAPAPALAM
jgi:AraC family transcriptional activator of tynA and feaB